MNTTESSAKDRAVAMPSSRPKAPSGTGAAGGIRDEVRSIPFSQTVYIELRKMVDTRSGKWLLGIMTVLSLIVVALVLIFGSEHTYRAFVDYASAPLVVILPVVGVMGATAEWSQRTGLVTFALEPRRGRVVAAKGVAAVVLGVVITASTLGAAALGTLVSSGPWDFTAPMVAGYLLAFAIIVLQGAAFGMLFLNTPVAIVAVLVLPTAWMMASSMVERIASIGEWLDLNRVLSPLLMGEMTGQAWVQLATAVGFGVALPMAIGTWRVLTREVK